MKHVSVSSVPGLFPVSMMDARPIRTRPQGYLGLYLNIYKLKQTLALPTRRTRPMWLVSPLTWREKNLKGVNNLFLSRSNVFLFVWLFFSVQLFLLKGFKKGGWGPIYIYIYIFFFYFFFYFFLRSNIFFWGCREKNGVGSILFFFPSQIFFGGV